MPDVLGNQQTNQEDQSGLGSNQGKSPLEEDNLKSPPSPPPPPSPTGPGPTAPPPPPPTDQPPPPTETPSGAQGGPNGTVPDTEEFLKSILEETPSQPAAPVSEPAAPSAGAFGAPAGPETPAVAPPPPPPAGPGIPPAQTGEPKIKDSVSGWDDIMASPEAQVGQAPPSGGGVGQDMGAIQTQPQGKGSLRLIILVLVVVAIAVGGYFAYTTFFSTPSKESTEGTSLTTPSPVAVKTNDEIRKSDLASLQSALKNYFAGSGSYPVADKLILLGSENNALSTGLVPNYLDKIPLDPDYPSKQYGYISDGKTFTLSAIMDAADDPSVVTEGGLYLYKVTPTTLVSDVEEVITSPTPVSSEEESIQSEGLNL